MKQERVKQNLVRQDIKLTPPNVANQAIIQGLARGLLGETTWFTLLIAYSFRRVVFEGKCISASIAHIRVCVISDSHSTLQDMLTTATGTSVQSL